MVGQEYLMESLLDATKHRDGSQNLPLPIKIGSYEFFNDIRLIDVENGVVTLTGEVDSDAERDLAVEIAKNASDVKDVENNLRVVTETVMN